MPEGTIRIFMLANGEYICTKVIPSSNSGPDMWEFPIVYNLLSAPGGNSRLSYRSFLLFTESITMPQPAPSHIMASYPPDRDIKEHYEKMVDQMRAKLSGIIIPNRGPGV